MLPSFATDSVTVYTPSTIVSRGSTIEDWSAPAQTTIDGCRFHPGASSRDMAERDGVTIDATLYAPPGTVIDRHARIEFDGYVYTVAGIPHPRRSPSGAVDHVKVLLRTWEG